MVPTGLKQYLPIIASKLDSNDIVQTIGYNTVTTNTCNVIIIQDLEIKQPHLMIVGIPIPLLPNEEKTKQETTQMDLTPIPVLLPT
jgi:hypothetical protein